MSQCAHVPGRIWPQLPPEIAERIAGCLSRNDVACTLRQINKAAAEQFRGPQHTKVRLSLPTPAREFTWRWGVPGATRGLTYRQRIQLLCLTVSTGSIPNTEVALASAGCLPTGRVFGAAAASGQLHMCEWLLQQGCPWDGALDAAAQAGQRDACNWLIERRLFEPSGRAYRSAARGGHVGLMEELLQRCRADPAAFQTPPEDQAGWALLLVCVAWGCDLATLQRLHREWVEVPDDGAQLQQAGQQGEQQAQLWFGMSVFCSNELVAAAAGSPTPDWRAKVEWLEGRGYPKAVAATNTAVEQPDAVERLGWLGQRGYTRGGLYPLTIHAAGRVGNIGSLEYLRSNGAPLFALRNARVAAAIAGQLAALVWLMEVSGSQRGETATDDLLFDAAAESGNLEVLAWLHSRGYTWGERTLARAAAAGNELMLEWLVERGCPMQGHDGSSPYVEPCLHNDLATLRCLVRLGCPWGPPGKVFNDACSRLHTVLPPTLRGLLSAGCPVDWEAAEATVRDPNSGCRDPAVRDEVLALLAEERARRQHLGHEGQRRSWRQCLAAALTHLATWLPLWGKGRQ